MQLLSRIIKGESVACQEDCLQLPLLVVVPREPAREVSPEPDLQGGEAACESEEKAKALLAAARAECEDLLARAKAECEAMLAAAAEEVQKLRAEAEKAGFAAGREEGLAAAEAERKKLVEEAERLLAEAREIRREMLGRVEGQVVRLAVRIAEKLLQTELQQHPEAVAAMVHSALLSLAESGEILIRLHPDDAVVCRAQLAGWQEKLQDKAVCFILEDAAMPRGTCRLETADSIIECNPQEQLEKLQQLLQDVKHDG
ncbi:MAG: hypothetical protein GX200_06900 [Firmicutes bacterium]|nr:hypothetical protein [Bacillota bacterium]